MVDSDQKTDSQSNQQKFQPSADAFYTAASVAALNGSFSPETLANADVINADVVMTTSEYYVTGNKAMTSPRRQSPSIGNSQATIKAAATYPHASYCNSNNNPLALLQHPAMNPAMQLKPNDNQNHLSFTLPQQLLHFNSLHSYAYRGPTQDSTPAIFQNVALRRGKWTAEEETYANAIIEAFEKGAIRGCENGCTLRAYLSRNLHCQPMRISKKYAGKAIGKQVFLSRLNVASERSIGSSNTEALKQLEFQFHMSVVQEGMSSDIHHQKNAIVNGHGVAINPFFSGWHQQGHQSQHQTSSNNVSETTFLRQPISVEATVIEPNPTTFKAPQPIVPSRSKTSSATVETNNESESDYQANYPNTSTNNKKNSHAQMNLVTSQIHQNLFNAFKQAQTSYPGTNPNNHQNSEQNKHANEQYQSNSANDSAPTGSFNSGQAQQNWINETMAIIPTLDPSNYNTGRSTPTYTSKSFDDLHQLIGKDLPNTRSANFDMVGPATYATNKMAMEVQMPSTTVTHHQNIRLDHKNSPGMNGNEVIFAHASDEYAYFAKQSIIEASKHSAYHTCPHHHPQPEVMPQIRSDTPIVSHPDDARNNLGPPPSRPLKFNKVNVKLHSKSQENKKVDAILQSNPSLPLTLDSQSSEREPKCNSIPAIHRHTPVVSASEGTDRSAESSSMGGSSSRSSGSDDNSDSASDEGQRLSLEQRKKRKLLDMEEIVPPSKIGKKIGDELYIS